MLAKNSDIKINLKNHHYFQGSFMEIFFRDGKIREKIPKADILRLVATMDSIEDFHQKFKTIYIMSDSGYYPENSELLLDEILNSLNNDRIDIGFLNLLNLLELIEYEESLMINQNLFDLQNRSSRDIFQEKFDRYPRKKLKNF